MAITPNLNNLARVIYGVFGLGLIVWGALGKFGTPGMIVLLGAGVILLAEGGAGW